MITPESVGGAFPVKPLGEVVEFLDSKRRPVKESERRSGPFPYYGANGQQGTIDDYIFDEPLLLLAEDGGHFDEPERGIAYRISGKTWVNNHAHVIRPRKGLDIDFLCRVLENYDVSPFVSGTTRGKLTKGQAERIEVPLPPISEQCRIAAILDQADVMRRKRRLTTERLRGLPDAIFTEMFGDPGASRADIQNSPLARVAQLINGDRSSNYPSGDDLVPSGVLFLSTKNIQDAAIDLSSSNFITEQKFCSLSQGKLRRHDLACDQNICAHLLRIHVPKLSSNVIVRGLLFLN
jgi:type I restriction enzyme S subunit